MRKPAKRKPARASSAAKKRAPARSAKAKKPAARRVAKPAKRVAAPRKKPVVIDIHAHITVPEVEQYAAPHSVSRGGSARVPEHRFVTDEHRQQAADWIGKVRARMASYEQRIKDMDEAGVDIQVLTLSLISHHTYWAGADEEESAKMERLANDRMAEIIHKYPGRFVGMGGVPLHSLQFAVNELERCMGELGFKGVQVSSMAGDMELGDDRLRPFWKRAEELGAAIYLHPAGVWDVRYAKHQLWNSIGQPLEEAMAMASLMYEGILDDFPKLKICVAHGGGFSPYYAGRLDRNYYDKPYLRLKMSGSPSEYLRNSFYYDTCVYNPEMLDTLVDKVGPSRIILGSDYPVGEEDPVGFVKNSKKLSAKDKEDILQNNAAKMLGISI
jgi:aminocarboxymuconate-semialdehyde decarboxylase